MKFNEEVFLKLGLEILGRSGLLSPFSTQVRYRAVFGTSPLVISTAWNMIQDGGDVDSAARPYHLLWACLFLKLYNSESVNCVIVTRDKKKPVHEETFRKWSWYFVRRIAVLQSSVICWENRLESTNVACFEARHIVLTCTKLSKNCFPVFPPFLKGWGLLLWSHGRPSTLRPVLINKQ
jgi:hypothetical protein